MYTLNGNFHEPAGNGLLVRLLKKNYRKHTNLPDLAVR